MPAAGELIISINDFFTEIIIILVSTFILMININDFFTEIIIILVFTFFFDIAYHSTNERSTTRLFVVLKSIIEL